jgi:hypothetical protein
MARSTSKTRSKEGTLAPFSMREMADWVVPVNSATSRWL